MKRSVLTLLFAAVFLLSACTSADPEIHDSFRASLTVTGSDTDYAAEISALPEGVIISMTSPASVAGMTYIFTDTELQTSLGDMCCISAPDSLPSSSAPALLHTVLSQLGRAAYVSSENGEDTFELSLSAGKATIICKDGIPIRVTADGSPYTFLFDTDG